MAVVVAPAVAVMPVSYYAINIKNNLGSFMHFFESGCLDPVLMCHHTPLLLLCCQCFQYLHSNLPLRPVMFCPVMVITGT